MSNERIFLMAVIGVLLVCGYAFVLRQASRRMVNRAALPLLAGVLLVVYAMVAGTLIYVIGALSNTRMMLFILMMMVSCVIFFAAAYGLLENLRSVNKGMLALFLAYALVVAYATVFSREYGRQSVVYGLRTDLILQAIRTGSLKPVGHLLLNAAMFVPMGILIPLVYPQKLNRWSHVILLAMMTSTLIETVQFFRMLGQADLTDIMANSLGAAIGFAGYRIYRRLALR